MAAQCALFENFQRMRQHRAVRLDSRRRTRACERDPLAGVRTNSRTECEYQRRWYPGWSHIRVSTRGPRPTVSHTRRSRRPRDRS
jgi:hypothetical protein